MWPALLKIDMLNSNYRGNNEQQNTLDPQWIELPEETLIGRAATGCIDLNDNKEDKENPDVEFGWFTWSIRRAQKKKQKKKQKKQNSKVF